jgi:hypothetical protein
MGVSGQRHAPTALYPWGKDPGTYCTGGWVGLRPGMDREARGKILSPLPGIEPVSPRRPVRSQTLYWLSYPDHDLKILETSNSESKVSWNTGSVLIPWLLPSNNIFILLLFNFPVNDQTSVTLRFNWPGFCWTASSVSVSSITNLILSLISEASAAENLRETDLELLGLHNVFEFTRYS